MGEEAKYYKLLLTQKPDHIELSAAAISALQPEGVQSYSNLDAFHRKVEAIKAARDSAPEGRGNPNRSHNPQEVLALRRGTQAYALRSSTATELELAGSRGVTAENVDDSWVKLASGENRAASTPLPTVGGYEDLEE